MAEGGQATPTHEWWKQGRDRQAVQREDMGMCALHGRHVQGALSAASGVLVPCAKGAQGRREGRVDPVAGPGRQGGQDLGCIAQ